MRPYRAESCPWTVAGRGGEGFEHATAFHWATGVLNGFAAGTLTHLASEMISSDHSDAMEHELIDAPDAPERGRALHALWRVLAFGVGALLMGVIAIWT